MIRVAIIEDQALLSNMLAAWLSRQPACQVMGVAPTGAAGRELCLATFPDVVLIDIGLPDIDGLELAKQLIARQPGVRVLVMSGREDMETIHRVWHSGVQGFVEKSQSPAFLWEAICTVHNGSTFFGSAFNSLKQAQRTDENQFRRLLSPRESEVLHLMMVGESEDVIAARLGIAQSTVIVHRKHIRQKLGIGSDRELITSARRWGIEEGIAKPEAASADSGSGCGSADATLAVK